MKKLPFLFFLPAVFLLTLVLNKVQAQNPNPIQADLPKVIPPSPEAAAFARYGEIPVDYSTGVPNISIPVYTIKSRKLELPISLSYHASGIKVKDVATSVGLGWVLNAGGIVSQTIISKGDGEFKAFYKTVADWKAQREAQCNSEQGFTNFTSILGQNYDYRDWQSDRYFFLTPGGQSGIFRYDFVSDSLIKIPYNPVRIQKNGVTGFTITAEDGTIYNYNTSDNVEQTSNSWVLTNMISSDLTDTIRFFYKTEKNYFTTSSCVCILNYGEEAYNPSGVYTTSGNSVYMFKDGVPIATSARILDSITSSTTVVRFSVMADRADGVQYRINKIAIYDRLTGSLLREVNLKHSNFGSAANNKRMRLDGLWVGNNRSDTAEKYSFTYEYAELPPTMGCAPFSEDYWGYYNGSYSQSQIPQQYVPTQLIGPSGTPLQISADYVTDRSPNHQLAKSGMIKEIRYPTGGRTVFEFEPNHALAAYDYPNSSSSYSEGDVGGFRIRKISSFANDNDLTGIARTYTYAPGITNAIRRDFFTYWQDFFYSWGTVTAVTQRRVSVSSSLLPLVADNGNTAFYPKVTEYLGTETANTGKTEYNYATPPGTEIPEIPALSNPYQDDRGNYTPRLDSRIEYRNENGTYKPVRKTANTYTPYHSKTFNTGIHVVHTRSYPNGASAWVDNPYYTNTLGYPYYFDFFDTKAVADIFLIDKTRSFLYSDDGQEHLVDEVGYTYGNVDMDHLQPREETTVNSKGDTIKTLLRYPSDFPGMQPYSSMVGKNILTPVIAREKYKGPQLLQGSKTNYKDWGNNIIAPETVEMSQAGNPYETRIRFNAYDNKGNALSVSKENNVKIAYIWGYQKIYPIAEVTNAADDQVAYTSFESGDDIGGWSMSYGSVIADGITGTKSFTGALFKTVPAGNYIVSLWGIGNQTVNGQAGQVLQTIGSWSLKRWVLNNPGTIYLNATTSADRCDEIRLYPSSAQMTTYTFAPMIGMTSKCDASNHIQYYEYDSFGRLALIRDERRNVLKKFCYNYKGQEEKCNDQ